VSETATTLVVPMPHMGVSVEEGTIIEWLKEVGDAVEAEEVICAIATDKVDTEVLAPADGVLAKIVVAEGENVAVGEPIAEMAVGAGADATSEEVGGAPRSISGEPTPGDSSDPGSGGSAAGASSPTPGRSQFQSNGVENSERSEVGAGDGGLAARVAAGRDEFGRFDPKAAAEAVVSFVAAAAESGGRSASASPASPVAKRMAAKHGIDLGAVEGSGRGGRIRKADVERAIAGGTGRGALVAPGATKAPPASAGPQLGADGLPAGYEGVPHEVVKTTRIRQLIAEHMIRSRQTAAHMTTEVDVDLSAVIRARTELNVARLAGGESKLSFLPFIARAACVALGEYPELNATFLGERTIHWQAVNLGVAVDTPEGLLVPVVRDCERLTAPAIGEAIGDLAERARTRKLAPDDLAGGTFTLSNPGSVGAVSAPAIINQPQVAILGVPTIQRRPWAIADEHGSEAIAIRSILRLAVTFDHRAVDGAGATRFAVAVKEHLEAWSPEAYT
jgi:pyruvate dehydrogenase E2 component (dihydrolipoamide acetyltransferase)